MSVFVLINNRAIVCTIVLYIVMSFGEYFPSGHDIISVFHKLVGTIYIIILLILSAFLKSLIMYLVVLRVPVLRVSVMRVSVMRCISFRCLYNIYIRII